MKTIYLNINWLIMTLCLSSSAEAMKKEATSFSDVANIKEVTQFDQPSKNNHLTVFNVYGSVEVVGYSGDVIQIEASKQIHAKNQQLVDQGVREIGLKIEKHGEKIYAYLDSPFTYIDHQEDRIWYSDTCWRHDDCSRKHPRKNYQYHMDIKVKVPQYISLKVSTINDGDITVAGIDAQSLEVNNINGAIDMTDVSGQIAVNSINRDINVAFNKNPMANSQFQSINGDINITFAGTPDAEVVYQTMNGDMYTAFDVSIMTPKVKRTSKKKEHGIKYKLDAESRLLVGSGGPEYRFETLNGDIKIK